MKAKDLRNSILQMAVQGKLVSQDPNDEPASVLLERIRKEKHKLIAEGKAKFPKGGESIIYTASDGSPYEKRVDKKGRVLSDECIANDIPFEIPDSWEWVRLDSISLVLNGDRGKNYPAKSKLHKSGIPFVSAVNIEDGIVRDTNMLYLSEDQYQLLRAGRLQRGDHVFCIRGSLGKHGVYPFACGAIASSLAIVRPISSELVSPRFIELLFDSPITMREIRRYNNGTAQPNLSAKDFQSFLYPLPPLAEQRRIVERINQLMPLVEEYGELEDTREELDAALPDRLRKSVLQMAVQGKLVEQNPDDEPASVLLQRIRKERASLVAEGKAKFPKGGESIIYTSSDGRHYEKRIDKKGRILSNECIEDELPFEIPKSWEWARLSVLIELLSGTDLSAVQYNNKQEGIPYITGASNFDEEQLIENRWTSMPTRVSERGDLLFTCKGTVGTMAINPFEQAHIARQIMAIRPIEQSITAYIRLFLRSMVEDIKSKAKGVIPGVERSTILDALIPLPPLAEQQRIAKRVAELVNILS